MEIGDWIEYSNMIIEVTAITKTDIIGREILFMKAFRKLRYGETIIISKSTL